MRHIVALSGGKDSTAMALRLAEMHPEREFTWVCTPTGDEPAEMVAHWQTLGGLLGKPILPIMNVNTGGLNTLIQHYNALPNRQQRWCTRELKIEPYREWLAEQSPCMSYVGLRADEQGRAGGAYADIPGVEMSFPLREWGWGLQEVLDYLDQRGVLIPKRTDCRRCYHQQIGEWYDWWLEDPDGFQTAVDQENQTGHTFRAPKVKDGTPVITTRWPTPYPASWRDSWPVRLTDMRALWERGYRPDSAQKTADLFRDAGTCRVCTL